MKQFSFSLERYERGWNGQGFYGSHTPMNFCPGPGAYSPFPHLNPAKLRTSSSNYYPDHMRSGSISNYSKMTEPWTLSRCLWENNIAWHNSMNKDENSTMKSLLPRGVRCALGGALPMCPHMRVSCAHKSNNAKLDCVGQRQFFVNLESEGKVDKKRLKRTRSHKTSANAPSLKEFFSDRDAFDKQQTKMMEELFSHHQSSLKTRVSKIKQSETAAVLNSQ